LKQADAAEGSAATLKTGEALRSVFAAGNRASYAINATAGRAPCPMRGR
jgi:hypothetical protein